MKDVIEKLETIAGFHLTSARIQRRDERRMKRLLSTENYTSETKRKQIVRQFLFAKRTAENHKRMGKTLREIAQQLKD